MKYRKSKQIPRQILSLVLCLTLLLALFPGLAPAVYAAEAPEAQSAYATREYTVSEFVQSVGRNTMGKSDYILSTFTDADEIDEAYVDDLSRAINQGILRGYADHSLRPKEYMLRIEALVMLSRILPDLEPTQEPIPFTDVPAWAKEDIDRLSAAGVVKGYGNGCLGSNDYITVEQVGLLTDRSDVLLNRYTPGESFFAYINDKDFRNYIPGESVVDPIHGVVVRGVDGWSTFGDRADEIAAQEEELLRQLGSGELQYEENSPAQRLYDLYDTWMHEDEDLETEKAQVRIYVNLLLHADTPETFMAAAAAVYRETGTPVMFAASMEHDEEAGAIYPSLNSIYYSPVALLAYDPQGEELYGEDCLNALADFAAALDGGFTAEDAKTAYELQKQVSAGMDYYWNYESGLKYAYDDGALPDMDEDSLNARLEELKSLHPEFYGEDADTEYHPMTLEEAADVFSDPLLDVQKLLTDVGFHDFDTVMMTKPICHAMKDLRITQENLNAWKINAVFYLCDDLGIWYTQEQEDASMRFSYYGTKALYGGAYTLEDYLGWIYGDPEDEESEDSEEEDPFEVAIYDSVSYLLPNDIGRLWCEYYYSADTTEDVLSLVEDVLLAYRARFEANEWLDDETRANAEKKLDSLMVYLGCRDDDSPEIFSRAEGGTFLSNICSIYAKDLQNIIRNCVDRDYFREIMFIEYDSVNAWYVATLNSINIPAGILGGVFYNPDNEYASNLGAIGMVVGHEIGHAFDRSGAQYDENGAKVNWWSEEATAAYEALMDRFLTYYGNYDAIGGVVQDPDLTIEENMADFAAMTVVMDLLADDPEGQRIALEAYATMWGEILSEDVKYYYLGDEHSANQVRVNAIVSSLDCFYELYDISEDDPMYVAPEDRLRLW